MHKTNGLRYISLVKPLLDSDIAEYTVTEGGRDEGGSECSPANKNMYISRLMMEKHLDRQHEWVGERERDTHTFVRTYVCTYVCACTDDAY
jgi:hypothetical protein